MSLVLCCQAGDLVALAVHCELSLLNRPLKQLLETWRAAGLTHLPSPSQAALDRLARLQAVMLEAAPAQGSQPVTLVSPPTVSASPELAPLAPPSRLATGGAPQVADVGDVVAVPLADSGGDGAGRQEPLSREQRVAALQVVADRVAVCQKCRELASTRTQTVFGVGNPEARIMFIGEAPGADEDREGEPFVGKAGQLLNKIITACGWQRHELYICNILRCHPPGNRTPEKSEADQCREFLDAQIRIVNPEYIVCWGSCAAQNLLGVLAPIGKMRQQWYRHGRAKVLCTYHPSYLLRNEDAKKPVWDDMKLLLAEMGQTPPR